MNKLSLSNYKERLHNLYELKIPLIAYGGYGIGKTEIEKEVAQEIATEHERQYIEWNSISQEKKQEVEENPQDYFVNVILHLGQFDPVDLHGLPKLNGNDYTEWMPIRIIGLLSQPELEGILFLDEYPQAREDIQKASTQLIRDRQMNEIPLSEGVYVCAAGNREQDNSGVMPLLEHVKDRYAECEIQFEKEYYIGDDLSDGFFGDRLFTPLYIFLKYDPSWLYKVDNVRQDKASTPRGIMERAHPLLLQHKDEPEKWYDDIAISVGESFASSFMSWYKIKSKLDIEGILKDPTKVGDIQDPAALFSLITVLFQRYQEDYSLFDKIISIVNQLNQNRDGAYAMTLLKRMKNCNPTGFRKILRHPAWQEGLAQTYSQFVDLD